MITCDICGFETDNKKVYANHRRWKHIVNRDSIEYKNFVDKCRPSTKPRITKDCICDICGKTFQLTLRESEWRKKKTFRCSSFCAHSRSFTEDSKKLKSQKAKSFYKNRYITKSCPFCGVSFTTTAGKDQKYCSKRCGGKSKANRLVKTGREAYKDKCKFTFNLKDFPNEFDFNLLKELGMYAPNNAKNPNPGGLARDHRISIEYGWRHNIDPSIISHPANCRLITQNENERKHTKCEITLEQLLKEISIWDKKYGAVAEKVMH